MPPAEEIERTVDPEPIVDGSAEEQGRAGRDLAVDPRQVHRANARPGDRSLPFDGS